MSNEQPTQDVLLNEIPVHVLDTIEREGKRNERRRAAQIRVILAEAAERYKKAEADRHAEPQAA